MDGNTFFLNWEISLIEWLQANLSPFAISIISLFSAFGEEILLIAIIGYLYWCYDKELGRKMGLSILLANCWNPMIKNIFLRRRPYFESEKIELLRKLDSSADAYDIKAQGFSFPSGHSTNAVAVYGSLAKIFKKKYLVVIAFIVPVIVGFSRITVGAHYPTDVLFGWFMGLVAIYLFPAIEKKINNKKVFYILILITVLPGVLYCKSDDYFSALGLIIGFFLAEPVEKKYTKFENTKSIFESIIRILGGGVLYVILNTLLKLPFSKDFLESGTLGAHLVRSGRYTIIMFLALAIYPMVFKYIKFRKRT